MLSRRIQLWPLLLLAAVAWVAPAGALTLGDLTSDTPPSFSSLDGSLTFSEFDVLGTLGVTSDLDQYEIIPINMGFRLEGPIESDGDFPYLAALLMAYTVTANGPILHAKVEVGIETEGKGAAGVLEWWKDPETHALLETALLIGDDDEVLKKTVDLSEHQLSEIRVKKKIFAAAFNEDHHDDDYDKDEYDHNGYRSFGGSYGGGDECYDHRTHQGFSPFTGGYHSGDDDCEEEDNKARVLYVEQTYCVGVPEPASLGLLGAGFAALIALRRRTA